MRSSMVADVVIHSSRTELTRVATDHLKMKGVSNLLTAETADDCIDALNRFPRGLLIIDWELGAPVVVKVLAYNRRRFGGQLRPILLVAPRVSEQVVATAAEYAVSQIFTEAPTLKNLGARLSHLLLGEGIPDEVKQALSDVHTAREGGDLKGGVQILLKLLGKHPQNLRVKCEAAEMLLRLGEPDKAFKMLEGMDKTKPPYLRGIHLLGRSLMMLGRFDESLTVLEQAQLFNPHDVDRLVDIGQALLHGDRVKDAAVQFDAALALDPKHKGARKGKGQCELMDGDVNAALAILKDVAGEVEMASLFNTCAVMNMRHGRHDAGMALYQAALKALGKDPRVQARLFFNMGLGYRRWGKKKEAQGAFEQALRLDPAFDKAQAQLSLLAKPAAAAPAPKKSSGNSTADALLGMDDFSPLDGGNLFADDDLEETLFSGRKPA